MGGQAHVASYLAISHSAADLFTPQALRRLKDTWGGSVQQQLTFRDHQEVARFFTGLELIDPGLVPVDQWRAEPATAETGNSAMWAGVARKP
jgi:S-adenosyl methyltransferase